MNIGSVFAIFESAIVDYHRWNLLDKQNANPFESSKWESILYEKCWIDTVQWHCEDEVRNPTIEAERVRFFKNKIDALNQTRTNLVEQLDDFFLALYQNILYKPEARLNTESPAWAIDRLSILALKIYHMREEVERIDLGLDQFEAYQQKLELLLTQKLHLIEAIEKLLGEIEQGETMFKVYRQVKMYNDSDLNPLLRAIKP